MIVLESKLAKKYAVAFLNACCKTGREKELCSISCIEEIKRLSTFLGKDKVFQAVLNLPSLSSSQKQEIVEHVSDKLQIKTCLTRLILLLLKDKRIDLLENVIKKVSFLHKQRQQKHHFCVTTSHELTKDEQEKVLAFITSLVPNDISASFTIDQSLISGIKISGHGLLLERSIAKQLRTIEQNIVRQE